MLAIQGQEDPHGVRRQIDIQQLQRVRALLDAADETARPASETLDAIAQIVGGRETIAFQPRSWR